jgi:hypothetical protein
VRRHGLSAGEASVIAADVPRGRCLSDPRLRPVAVEWAHELLEQERVRGPQNPRARQALLVLLICWAAAVLAWLFYRVVSGHPEDVNWVSVLLWAAALGYLVRRRRLLRRTMEVNAEPSSGDDS